MIVLAIDCLQYHLQAILGATEYGDNAPALTDFAPSNHALELQTSYRVIGREPIMINYDSGACGFDCVERHQDSPKGVLGGCRCAMIWTIDTICSLDAESGSKVNESLLKDSLTCSGRVSSVDMRSTNVWH